VNDILADTEKRRGLLGDTSILELPRRTAVVNGMVGGDTESWTVGYTPQFVVGVHMERADGSAMAIDPLGLQGAAPVWRAVMQYAHERDGIPADDHRRVRKIRPAAQRRVPGAE
jgi:penicillin-binding protein 1C